MKTKIKEELELLKERFPRFEALSNLLSQLEHLEASPDTLVDYAHALTEGVSKNARRIFDNGATDRDIEGQTNTGKHLKVLRPNFERLDPDFDESLFESIHTLLEHTRATRNKRGDTSHGHLGPKDYTSPAAAHYWLAISIAYARYVFALLDEVDPDRHIYDEQDDFNAWLNDKGESIGGSSYSWLVYQHDYPLYENFMEEYIMDNIEEE